MAHQLYVLQTLQLGLLEQRMNSKMDPQDQDSLEKIKVCMFVYHETRDWFFYISIYFYHVLALSSGVNLLLVGRIPNCFLKILKLKV